MIVKVQISLATNADERQVLIRDEDDEFLVQLPLSTCVGLEALLDPDLPRGFFEAEIVNHKIQLGRRLPEQGW